MLQCLPCVSRKQLSSRLELIPQIMEYCSDVGGNILTETVSFPSDRGLDSYHLCRVNPELKILFETELSAIF